MSVSLADLERRRAELLSRCATERGIAASAGLSIRAQLAPYDSGLATAQRWLSSPLFVGAGVALGLILGRAGGLRRMGGALGLVSAALQLRSFLASKPPAG